MMSSSSLARLVAIRGRSSSSIVASAAWTTRRTVYCFRASSSFASGGAHSHQHGNNQIRSLSSSSSSSSSSSLSDSIINRIRSLSTATRTAPPVASAAPPLTTSTSTSSSSQQDFPSLVISSTNGSSADSSTSGGGIRAIGAFAETTAEFLNPDPVAVQELVEALRQTKTGIVAHYYMDVELQGVLTAVAQQLPHRIGIADSLKMGDMAVQMASSSSSNNTENNPDSDGDAEDSAAQQILCLGVDFMAESVQAILNKNGKSHIPVYRADARKIGCSLAESAEQDAYRAWLQQESSDLKSSSSGNNNNNSGALHVVYINTSLETKAVSSSLVPTITCTSSNVLQTLLQAATQVPDIKILYGPDTYMGHNLQRLLELLSETWTDDEIRTRLHASHDRESLRQLRQNLVVFPAGNCVVHHMFGQSVVDTVQQQYLSKSSGADGDNDVFVTAHLEVPGEMFEIAMVQALTDNGVAGSTSDILHFIKRKVQDHASRIITTFGTTTNNSSTPNPKRLKFILGTEAGMVTSIVQSVQQILNDTLPPDASQQLEVEIVFPVASDAVMATTNDDSSDSSTNSLELVPGVSGGEGCSTAGGCATCPFMKMNDLDAVMGVLELIQNDKSSTLQSYLPPDRLGGRQINGHDAMDLGTLPILYMRQFMLDSKIPDELCQSVLAVGGKANNSA